MYIIYIYIYQKMGHDITVSQQFAHINIQP